MAATLFRNTANSSQKKYLGAPLLAFVQGRRRLYSGYSAFRPALIYILDFIVNWARLTNIGTLSVQELFFQLIGLLGVRLGVSPVGMVELFVHGASLTT